MTALPEAYIVKQLIAYLRENMILDFQGDLSLEQLREFVAGDDSRAAKALLAKVVEERGVENMLVVLADCLVEQVRGALTDDVIRDQLSAYAES